MPLSGCELRIPFVKCQVQFTELSRNKMFVATKRFKICLLKKIAQIFVRESIKQDR